MEGGGVRGQGSGVSLTSTIGGHRTSVEPLFYWVTLKTTTSALLSQSGCRTQVKGQTAVQINERESTAVLMLVPQILS